MKIGFLFPGQGAQSVGMGKELYDNHEEYREVYEKIDSVLGENIENITFEEPEEKLNRTDNTQIAILTMSLATLAILKKEGIVAKAASGLSLGEYSALIESGAISLEDGAKIVKKRGELMHNLCPKGNWAMAAILGLEENIVNEICKEIEGFVIPANFNCPGQIVISGEKEAISKAMEIAKTRGAKRVIELKTSGPFHTEMLKEASSELRKELDEVDIDVNKMKTEVVKNIDGKAYTSKDDIRDILAKHIISPVRFEECAKSMIDMGIDTFIEIGPGKTLSGFVRKVNRDVKVFNVNDEESLQNTLKEIVEK